MVSTLRLLLAAVTCTWIVAPQSVAAQDAATHAGVYTSTALSESELDGVVGQGSPRGAFWQASAGEQAMHFDQQSSAINRVTFDNWFNDVGSVLIWNNVLQLR